MLKDLLKNGMGKVDGDVAIMFSGGIDSCLVYNLLKDMNANINAYCLIYENTKSDDLKFYELLCDTRNLEKHIISIPEDYNLTKDFDLLTNIYQLPKNKKSSLLVLSLFIYAIQNIKEKYIYTGLGSDSYYGIGRNFSIQCSLRGEKTPNIHSMQAYRTKTFAHYCEQCSILQHLGKEYGKTIVTPFLSHDVFNFMWDKTYAECNKPRLKQILIDVYPEFFKSFKARRPNNFQCGNSNFKLLLKGRKDGQQILQL